MSSMMRALRRMLGMEKNIDSIMSPMTKIVRNLEEYAEEQDRMKCERDEEAVKLEQRAKVSKLEAADHDNKKAEARAQAEKFESLFSA